jgi:hypothetical protein
MNPQYTNPFEAYGQSYNQSPASYASAPDPRQAQYQAQLRAQQHQQAQYQAQQQPQHAQSPASDPRQAQLRAQQQHQQAQYQTQMRAQQQQHQQAQYQAQMRARQQAEGGDPRYQHTYQQTQLGAQASYGDRVRHQESMAQKAHDAQARQYDILKKEQDKQITHLLYVDSKEAVCENAWKMCRGLPMVHVVDVREAPDDAIPDCVTFLPAIVDVRGKGRCYRGSKCDQYVKHLLKPKTSGGQRYIDPFKPVGNMLRIDYDKIENQEPILDTDTHQLEGAYDVWPEFDANPARAKAQSDAYLKRLKAKLDRNPVKMDPPIEDKNDKEDQSRLSKADADVRRRKQESNQPVRDQQVPVFAQQVP